MADNQNAETLGYAEQALSAVTDLINRRNYNQSVARARQAAERLVRSYCEEKDIGYTTLAETIEALYSAGAINMTSRDDFHALRVYGNKAAHDENCDEDDARNAYYYLNNEVQTWRSRNAVNVDRTPVRVDRNTLRRATDIEGGGLEGSRGGQDVGNARLGSGAADQGGIDLTGVGSIQRGSGVQGSGQMDSGSGQGVRQMGSGSGEGGSFVQSTPVRRRRSAVSNQGSSARRRRAGSVSGSQGRRGTGGRSQSDDEGGIDAMSVARVAIPVIILILIVIILVSLFGGGSGDESPTVETSETISETTEAETPAETSTEAPTEPPVTLYQIRSNATGVNVRYADNFDRVYVQLNGGYEIGEVSDYAENADFVQFTMDGIAVVVSREFIEPIEGSGSEETTSSSGETTGEAQ